MRRWRKRTVPVVPAQGGPSDAPRVGKQTIPFTVPCGIDLYWLTARSGRVVGLAVRDAHEHLAPEFLSAE